MSELIQAFPGHNYQEWADWYLEAHPDAIDAAAKRISAMVGNLRVALEGVTDDMIKRWVEDLVLVKTFMGLKFQAAVLKRGAELKGVDYRLATVEEEVNGIDGYIGDTAICIKPETYREQRHLVEMLAGKLVMYIKDKEGIIVDYGEIL